MKKENLKIQNLGRHLIFEFWKAKNLNSLNLIKKLLKEAVEICGATLLEIKVHKFSPQGITGIALISESHISIHTWPEYSYAAIDVFTCSKKVIPEKTLLVFKKFLKPKNIKIIDLKRGILI